MQANSLDLKNLKKARVKATQSITWFRLWERLKVGVNGMENSKGNGKTVKLLGRKLA